MGNTRLQRAATAFLLIIIGFAIGLWVPELTGVRKGELIESSIKEDEDSQDFNVKTESGQRGVC